MSNYWRIRCRRNDGNYHTYDPIRYSDLPDSIAIIAAENWDTITMWRMDEEEYNEWLIWRDEPHD